MGNWKITDYAEHFLLVLTTGDIRFSKIPLLSSFPHICEDLFRHFISHNLYIILYLILLILENYRNTDTFQNKNMLE